MFGSDTQTSNDDPAMLDNVKQLASQPADQVEPSSPVATATPATAQTAHLEPAEGFSSNPLPATQSSDDSTSSSSLSDSNDTSTSFSGSNIDSGTPAFSITPPPQPTTTTADDTVTNISSADDTKPVDHDQLASMKQEALAHLEPLTEHLDGTPEETFKTTMMMIQANDNHTLLNKALEAAKKIENDKARAQAMLDIVNEINYFSQNH
jgi:hypothetical protein